MKERPGCFVCTKSKGQTDEHHVLPVEYGGPKDGKTVPLCTSCHRGVHREAEALYSRKEPGTNFRSHLTNDSEMHSRFGVLSNYIVETKKRHVINAGGGKSETARNMVSVSLSTDQLKMLHAIKLSLGMTNISKVLSRLIVEKYEEIRRGK